MRCYNIAGIEILRCAQDDRGRDTTFAKPVLARSKGLGPTLSYEGMTRIGQFDLFIYSFSCPSSLLNTSNPLRLNKSHCRKFPNAIVISG